MPCRNFFSRLNFVWQLKSYSIIQIKFHFLLTFLSKDVKIQISMEMWENAHAKTIEREIRKSSHKSYLITIKEGEELLL